MVRQTCQQLLSKSVPDVEQTWGRQSRSTVQFDRRHLAELRNPLSKERLESAVEQAAAILGAICSGGMSEDEIRKDFPSLTHEHIRAVLVWTCYCADYWF